MFHKKKSFQHSATFIFVVTLIVSIILLGIFAYIILDIVVFKVAETGDIKIKQSLYKPKEKDNHTILIIGENDGKLEYISLMFYDAVHSHIMFIPVPVNTFSQVDTKKSTLTDFYGKKEPKILCKAVENLFDIPVQKYIELTPSLLNTVVNNAGSISFPLVCDMNYKNPETNEITKFSKDSKNIFGASDLRKIMLYPYFPNGIFQNMYYTGVISASVVNYFFATSDDIFSTLDIIYDDVILKSNTNIEEYDFYSRKQSLKYMLEKSQSPAIYVLPDGEINEKNYFLMTDNCKDTIHKYILD